MSPIESFSSVPQPPRLVPLQPPLQGVDGSDSGPEKLPPPSIFPSDQFIKDPILLKSAKGLDLLKHCAPAHLTTLPMVMSHFEAPDSVFEAGIASATMVANALGLSTKPILNEYRQDYGSRVVEFPYFSSGEVRAHVDDKDEIVHKGTTLQQVGKLLEWCGARTEVIHVNKASPAQVKAFRSVASKSLQGHASQILVNFLGLDGHGYHSPVAAYDQSADRFLIYNSTPPRPQPVWMKTEDLVRAMATVDGVEKRPRGYVLAKAPTDADGVQREPVGPMCVPLNTEEGTAILQTCEARHLSSLPGLMTEHQIQANLCTSGPASLASVGNDLGLLPKDSDRWTQERLVELLPAELQKEMRPPGLGLNLQQLEMLTSRMGAEVVRRTVLPPEEQQSGLEQFRSDCISALESSDSHVIVNYDRRKIGQRGRGHFSPIAAYNSTLDMFLIYETATFRVDLAWVSARDLHRAMAKHDDEIRLNRVPRGYLVVSNPWQSTPLLGLSAVNSKKA